MAKNVDSEKTNKRAQEIWDEYGPLVKKAVLSKAFKCSARGRGCYIGNLSGVAQYSL